MNIKHLFITTCMFGLVIASCAPASKQAPQKIITATPTLAATQTPALVSPSPTASLTAAPTIEPTAAALTLDKPMTTEFNLDLNAMPSASEQTVRSGITRQEVIDYLKTQAGGSLLNADGTVNPATMPAGMKPATTGQWTINTSPWGDKALFIKTGNKTWGSPLEFPIQPSNLQFRLEDGSGMLATELLYYINPQDGKTYIEPIFFRIDSSQIPKNNNLIKVAFGHSSPIWIAIPFVDVNPDTSGNSSPESLLDKAALLGDDMQADRVQFINQLIASQNPQGIGKFWWGPSGSDGPFSQ